MRRRAGRTDERGGSRQRYRFSRKLLLPNMVANRQPRQIEINRTGDVVLDPLTDIGIRMFMTIRIGSGQLVMDILSHREGC